MTARCGRLWTTVEPAPDADAAESMELLSDPARWPFCEDRARATAAAVAFPEPIPVGGRPYRWRKRVTA